MKQDQIATARSGKTESLTDVLARIQGMHTEYYTLMSEHWDWLVVLQCMQDHGLFKSNKKRPPFAAFEQWLSQQHVPQHIAHCSVRNLTYANKMIAGARYPWTNVAWEPHVLKRWRVTYAALAKMLTQFQDTKQCPEKAV